MSKKKLNMVWYFLQFLLHTGYPETYLPWISGTTVHADIYRYTLTLQNIQMREAEATNNHSSLENKKYNFKIKKYNKCLGKS